MKGNVRMVFNFPFKSTEELKVLHEISLTHISVCSVDVDSWYSIKK